MRYMHVLYMHVQKHVPHENLCSEQYFVDFSDKKMTEAEVVIDKLKESGIWIASPTLLEVSNFHKFFFGIN